MSQQDRETLKSKFANGRMPSGDNFGDLIDSMLNVLDEGFDKPPGEGLKVTQLGTGKLMSFYQQIAQESPIWSIGLGLGQGKGQENNLLFGSTDNKKPPVLSLALPGQEKPYKGRVGINKDNPEYELDVNGVIRAAGRIGVEEKADKIQEDKWGPGVLADGQWHPITDPKDGCQAFEIMAGVGGKENAGQYALLHAFAVNTFNSKSNITCHEAYYDSRCNQLELRWQGDTHAYWLELKTRCSYQDSSSVEYYIRYYITELWFDHQMKQSRQAKTGGQP